MIDDPVIPLGYGLLAEAGSDIAPKAPADEGVVLDLADLLPDENGEVVITSSEFSIHLNSDRAVAETGVAGDHVTAAGYDVSGFAYFSFEGGLTVFCQDAEALVVAGAQDVV